MINYEFNFLIAVLAFVYTYLLTRPNKIFNSLYNWLDEDVFKHTERRNQGKGTHWLFMILINCEQCIAGQLSFWLFLIFNYSEYAAEPFATLITHAFNVAFAILCSAVITGIYTKYIEQ